MTIGNFSANTHHNFEKTLESNDTFFEKQMVIYQLIRIFAL